MQGRLSPPFEGRFQTFPVHEWRAEFPRAKEAGLTSIEWIYETFHEEENPVRSDKGIAKILIGLGKGQRKYDKRALIKSKEWNIKKQRLEKNKQI